MHEKLVKNYSQHGEACTCMYIGTDTETPKVARVETSGGVPEVRGVSTARFATRMITEVLFRTSQHAKTGRRRPNVPGMAPCQGHALEAGTRPMRTRVADAQRHRGCMWRCRSVEINQLTLLR